MGLAPIKDKPEEKVTGQSHDLSRDQEPKSELQDDFESSSSESLSDDNDRQGAMSCESDSSAAYETI